jgi:HAD superfamily hydrolase (TIGR01509 family)
MIMLRRSIRVMRTTVKSGLMAVASGGSQAIVSATLQATVLELFDVIVTIDEVGRAKPAPDLFLETARRLGVPAKACLVFEDGREGFEAARLAGMRAVDVVAVLNGLFAQGLAGR